MSVHPQHPDMTFQQHNVVFKLLCQQYRDLYGTFPANNQVNDDTSEVQAAPIPIPVVEPVDVPTAEVVDAEPVIKASESNGPQDFACVIADTQHGNHKFMCTSFPSCHAFESATVLLQISVLRSGDLSVRTRMRIMRSVSGDMFQNVPALCGPVYHISASLGATKESSKDLVLPHAIISMFCMYTLLITKLRVEAMNRGILPATYTGHEFDKLPLMRRADAVFKMHALPDLRDGVSVLNEEQFDFVKPVNAAFSQLNTVWEYKAQPGNSKKRALDLSDTQQEQVTKISA